ncbi:MAG: carboxypeptidase-like regulatory domain-containing protein [Planctomycetota bacterium]
MAKKLILGVVLAAVVVALALAWRGRSYGRAAKPTVPVASQAAAADLAEPGAREEPTAGGGAVRELVAAPERAAGSDEGAAPVSPTPALRVRVVDGSGAAAAGVPVGLDVREDDHGWNRDPEVLVTGEDGLAVFNDLATQAPRAAEAGSRLFASLPFPLAEVVEVEVDAGALPVEPVVLVKPPTGRLILLVEDERGKPLTDLWTRVFPVSDGRVEGSAERRGRAHDVYTRDGRVVHPHVGIGLLVEAQAQLGGARENVELRRDGPTAPGEEVVIVLRSTELRPTLAGRLLDPEGRPVAERNLQGRIAVDDEDGGTNDTPIRGETDAGGRFRIAVRYVPEGASPRLELVPEPREGEAPLLARAAFELPLGPGDNDLGDLHCTAAPLLFRGRVTNPDGEPIYWALVRPYRKHYDDAERFRWFELPGLDAYSDRDGNFVAYGELDAGEYAVRARKDGFVPSDYLPLTPGAAFELVLDRVGAVEGALVLDESVPSSWITVRSRNDMRRGVPPSASGTFRLEGLFPGEHVVDVLLKGDATPLLEVEGVLVRGGETVRDPRLDGVDLTDAIRRFRLTLVDPDGRPVPSGNVELRPAGAPDVPARWFAIEDGAAAFLSREAALDVEVHAFGFRTARQEDVRGDREIRLERGFPVRVRLRDGVEIPEAPVHLRLVLAHADAYGEMFDARVTFADEDHAYQWWALDLPRWPVFSAAREVAVSLPDTGRYRVFFDLVVRGGENEVRSFRLHPNREDHEVVIAGTLEEQVFVLGPEPEDYASQLEAAR